MQVHERADVARSPLPLPIAVRRVDETLREPEPVLDVVAAAAPLPAVRRGAAAAAAALAPGRVARTVGEVARAASLGDGVRNSRARGGVHERSLPRTCRNRHRRHLYRLNSTTLARPDPHGSCSSTAFIICFI